jgi:3-oxoacyl-[acyl-carrier-protein] synthase II
MGFCLPGETTPVWTAQDLWDMASRGRSSLRNDGIYHSSVGLSGADFTERIPGIPGAFSAHFTLAHWYGLTALMEASLDAKLDVAAGDLTEAAILAGRGSVDANLESYTTAAAMDVEAISPLDALELYVATELSASPSDVALVQAALTRATGPCFTVCCGCASSAAQLLNAAMMITAGAVDLAVVTGVDLFNIGLVRKAQHVLRVAQRAVPPSAAGEPPRNLPVFDEPMRPYDRRAGPVNFGEGAATVILESRAHAEGRGAAAHGQLLSWAMTRDGLPHPLSGDDSGASLVAAVRQCLGTRWDIGQVGYVHGASDGNPIVTSFESNAMRQLYGPAARNLLMTSQEACFGHNGAPSGALGVALTLLMLAHREVCPTANCEQPAEDLSFDPVPGTRARPRDFDYALNLTYQMGGVKSVILLGRADDT